MKRTIASVILCAFIALALSSCGYRITKKTPEPEPAAQAEVAAEVEVDDDVIILKMGRKRGLQAVFDELSKTGALLDRDIHGRLFGKYEYTWELVVIRDPTDGVHAIVIEDGVVVLIEPVKSLEAARKKFKPYGGWKKK